MRHISTGSLGLKKASALVGLPGLVECFARIYTQKSRSHIMASDSDDNISVTISDNSMYGGRQSLRVYDINYLLPPMFP